MNLTQHFLIAMPGMQDPRFARSIVYLCAHSAEGAMGLIVNKRAEDLVWRDLFKRLGIPIGSLHAPRPVHYGGPVETGRGFVLHSSDYQQDSTLMVGDAVGLTATVDIDLRHPSLYLNRELSWLDFNDRVVEVYLGR